MNRLVRPSATTRWLLLGAAMLALGSQPTHAQQDAGVTAAVNPDATGTPPAEMPKVLEVGGNVVQNEHITTGDEGQVQLLFRDGSTMTMGPGADLIIDKFVYDPEVKTATLAMTAASGAFRFVGGRASKDEPVILNTPTATIGIRGGIFIGAIERDPGAPQGPPTTRASKLFGGLLTVTSKLTNETIKLTQNGFTVTARADGSLAVAKGALLEVLAQLKGRAGKNGGTTKAPNQDSQQAHAIASSNSSQPPGSFLSNGFQPNLSLNTFQSFTNQLVSNTAQASAIGNSITSSGVPNLPSGSYVGGILMSLTNGIPFGQGDLPFGLGGATYPTITYTESFTDGSTSTVTRVSSTFVTLLNGVPQGFANAQVTSSNNTSGGSFLEVQGVAAGIASAQVLDRGGDIYVQVGRLTGPAVASLFEIDNITNMGMNSPQSFGPTSATFASGLSAPYVIGVPATNVPTVYSGPITYNLIAATKPVYADGSGSPGTFTGTLSFAFGQSAALALNAYESNGASITSVSSNIHGFFVGLSATVTMPGDATYQLSTIGGTSNPLAQISALTSANGRTPGTIVGINEFGQTFKGTPNVVVQGLSRACPSGVTCTAALIGALAGPGGSRAGILYVIGNFTQTSGMYNLSQLILGTAAFSR